MKKFICSTLVLVFIAASMVSCGDTKEKESASAAKEESTTSAETTTEAAESKSAEGAIGKWQCEKLVVDGEEMDNFFGIDAYALFQIELKDGNKGTFYSVLYSEDAKPQEIEWENKGDKIQLISKEVFDEDEVFFVEENGKMILNLSDEGDEEESSAVLAKVDEFKEIPEDIFDDIKAEGIETEESAAAGAEAETTENKE